MGETDMLACGEYMTVGSDSIENEGLLTMYNQVLFQIEVQWGMSQDWIWKVTDWWDNKQWENFRPKILKEQTRDITNKAQFQLCVYDNV